jgi:tRNA dimethylallyltransferase
MKICIFVMGPTAAGKTDLAIHLTQHLPCDIISVDSAMVYREMDIGTAKPVAEILAQFPHRLINIRDPSEPYSAAQFREDALLEIDKIHAVGRIPLLVGGTGLYFRSLQQGLSDLPAAHPEVREQLNQEATQLGWQALHQRLAHIDPETAKNIHPNDPQRIQRALEVYLVSGRTMSQWYREKKSQQWHYPVIKIILSPTQRPILHAKITQRFYSMLEMGLLDEVNYLFTRGDLWADLPAIRAVGYRQVWQYLQGELREEAFPEAAIVATRQLAKRQLTWLRAESEGRWFDSEQPQIAQSILAWVQQQIDVITKVG